MPRPVVACAGLLLALGLAGCASPPSATGTPPAPAAASAETKALASEDLAEPPGTPARGPGAMGRLVGRSEHVAVYVPAAGDQLPQIARRLLGDAALDWRIAEANNGAPVQADVPLLVPLRVMNPTGVGLDHYQTVPVLCYHRFGSGVSKMQVTPERFEEQLAWLARNQYRVLRLSELQRFLAAEEPLPARSVVITIDDGYESVHRHAYPLLKKYGFTATLFVYTDFVGAGDALSWAQLREMAASGVIDIQAHSKTHRNLIQRREGETDAAYRQNIDAEVRQPRALLESRLAAAGVKVRHYAYPFGDANELVLEALKREGYEMGVTVNPGGNPFFADALMLRRTMIFGDHDIDDFQSRLQIRRPLPRR